MNKTDARVIALDLASRAVEEYCSTHPCKDAAQTEDDAQRLDEALKEVVQSLRRKKERTERSVKFGLSEDWVFDNNDLVTFETSFDFDAVEPIEF